MESPALRYSNSVSTGTRVPVNTGVPPRTLGSLVNGEKLIPAAYSQAAFGQEPCECPASSGVPDSGKHRATRPKVARRPPGPPAERLAERGDVGEVEQRGDVADALLALREQVFGDGAAHIVAHVAEARVFLAKPSLKRTH